MVQFENFKMRDRLANLKMSRFGNEFSNHQIAQLPNFQINTLAH